MNGTMEKSGLAKKRKEEQWKEKGRGGKGKIVPRMMQDTESNGTGTNLFCNESSHLIKFLAQCMT